VKVTRLPGRIVLRSTAEVTGKSIVIAGQPTLGIGS